MFCALLGQDIRVIVYRTIGPLVAFSCIKAQVAKFDLAIK